MMMCRSSGHRVYNLAKFENQVVYNHSVSTTMKGRLRQSGGNKESPTHTELLIQVCLQTITKDVRYYKHKFATKSFVGRSQTHAGRRDVWLS